MELAVHLSFNGECEEAFRFYEQCFAGEITYMLPFGPAVRAAVPAGMEGKIFHATLLLCGGKLTGADVASEQYVQPKGFSLQLNLNDMVEARRIFAQLASGGQVTLPLQETFWAKGYALLADRFGTPWEINCA